MESSIRSKTRGWDLVIGRRVGLSSPGSYGGLLAPIVACDQLYSFAIEELSTQLLANAEPVITAKRVREDVLKRTGRDLFRRIARATENVGALDSHRALNYLVVQHPGVFIAAAERDGNSVLDNIETRLDIAGLRRVITVVFTFTDRATGVPDRLFTRVDVTEEWPFLASGTPVALEPFIGHT